MRPGPVAEPFTEPGEVPTALPDNDVLGRCVRRNRDALGPELGRALGALQDDTLLEDACGLDIAVRAHAPERCASLRLSSLRETCAFRASIVAGRPEACPAAPGLRGRDPVCVALAARDTSLCAAASLTERARCFALAAGDSRPCEALDPLLRPTCVRDLDPLHALLPALPRATPRTPDAARNGWSTAIEDASVNTPVGWLLRGVFLDENDTLWFVDPALGWPAVGAMAVDRTLVGVRLPSRRGSALVLDARLVAVGVPVLSTLDGSLRAAGTLTHATHRRGGRVAGTLVFDGASAGRAVHLELHFDTFVRDVVMATALQ